MRLDLEIPKSLSTAVEERIRDAIVSAELVLGQPLSEDGIGLAMGVSRTPMREALVRLQAQGLVVIVPKKGTFVFNPSVEEVQQLAAFRLLLESQAVELSMAAAPQATLDDLGAKLHAMRRARSAGKWREYSRVDTDFHAALFVRCGNAYLVSAYRAVAWQIAALRAHLSAPHDQDRSFSEHEAIIAHYARGETGPIVAILREHIMRAAIAYRDAFPEGSAAGEAPSGRRAARTRTPRQA